MSDPKEDPESGLTTYRAKRTGGATPEPMASQPVIPDRRSESGGLHPGIANRGPRMYVVHHHDATRMHWDLRLEIDGVLVSWAVPKAPSMDADDKRLAMKVENHPLEYVHFEAVIPDGNYGAGPMIAWDRGCFRPLIDPAQGLRDGEIKFELYGYKLRGAFTLVHTGKRKGTNEWLLIKKRDEHATTEPTDATSVLSGLTVAELGEGAPRHKALLAEIAALGCPRRAIHPDGFEPMLCATADAAFSSSDWVFELKYDGFRLTAFGGAGEARLRYRSGRDPTTRFPEITSALRALPVPGVVLDGELVVLDGEGRPDFTKLQSRAQLSKAIEIQRCALTAPVTYVVFDLLAAGGYDLRGLPLLTRKALLAKLVPKVGPLRYAEHIPQAGEAFLAAVVAQGLEGVVAKKAASPYRSTRSKDWLKLKAHPEADFAVCGITKPRNSRTGFGALQLCVRVDDRWRYAGKVGSGFDDALLTKLAKELADAPTWKPTFGRPEGTSDTRWIDPERTDLVVQVRYHEWAEDGTLRHPVFLRLRDDKPALECGMPMRRTGERVDPTDEAVSDAPEPAPQRELKLTRLSKLFWKADGITKGDLIDYYRSIAPFMLPYLKDRPAVLTRYPDGIDGEMFYQKSMPDWVPPWLRTTPLWSEHSQREVHYVLLDDADGLAYVANLGAIPIHCWASRTSDLEKPDYTIVDLDPKNAPREHVVPLALAVHELCESIGLPNYVKTSGQTGLHILIPLGRQLTFDQARTLSLMLGMIVEQRHPTMATTNKNPNARGGRVYLDWGQNAHGQLLVAPYAVRPVPGAPVSMPLAWHEVVPGLDPKQFNVRTALARVSSRPDPCRPVLEERPDIAAVLERLTALTKG